MKQLVPSVLISLLVFSGTAMAGVSHPAPELDPNALAGPVAVAVGLLLLAVDSRRPKA